MHLNKMMNNWLVRGGCLAAAFFMAVTIFIRADSGAGIPLPAPWDKVAHFLYYGAMALLLGHGVGRRWIWVPLLLVPAIGALDEWHQAGIPGRDASFFDWLADGLGTVAFVVAYWQATKRGAAGRGPSKGEAFREKREKRKGKVGAE
jgi:VanZ family protein